MDWPLLQPLSEDERRRILVEGRRRRFARNEVIFHEGDSGDGLHLLAGGHVAMKLHTPLGDIATIRIVKPGEFFGELAVFSPAPRNATAIALDRTETLVLSRRQLEEMKISHAHVDSIVVEALATEVRRLARQVVDLMYLPAEKRLWRVVVELSIAYGSGGHPSSMVPLTQEVVAQLTGCTRSTANRLLRIGEEDRVIKMRRGAIDVLDWNSLIRRAQ
jgi:CRP/FNR family cyclic AMP-dependent transcriptional regulator